MTTASFADRVQETTTVTGTGTATLLGAVTDYQAFSAAFTAASTSVYYLIDDGAGNWEVGIGTYTLSGTTLSRTTVLASSTGSAISFAAGTKKVSNVFPAAALQQMLNGAVRAVTGTSDTLLSTDRGALVTYSNASAIAVGIAVASAAGFGSNYTVEVFNKNNGAVTITPTTSTINGAATLVLNRGDSALISSDGTNYQATVTRLQSRGEVALTDASTVAIDCSLGDNFYLLATSGVGGTRALGAPTNMVAGQVINIRYKQDAVGSRLLTYNSVFKWPGGTALTASTGANAEDMISAQYSAVDATWFSVGNRAFS
jgi:aspartate 1-decarboxylase